MGSPWRLARFVLERSVRIGVWVVTLSAFAMAFGQADLSWGLVARTTLVSAVLWAPTSLLRFRAAFYPGPPHPRLRDRHGHAWSFRDVVVTLRCDLAERAMASLPWMWVAGLAAGRLPGLGAPVAVVVGLLVGWSLFRQARHSEREMARLEAAVGYTASARRRLERLLWLYRGERADGLRHALAGVCFRAGDTDDALQMLDTIRHPDRWYVQPLRAQMLVASDPQAARAIATHPTLDPGQARMIQWLADLHEGQAERVRQEEEASRALLDDAAPDVAGMLRLLLAAAWAPVDPIRAAELLEEAAWTRSELPWLSQVWPAVGAPLAELRWREPAPGHAVPDA